MAATTINTDGITVSGQPAGTYGPVKLLGGRYAFTVVGGTNGQILKSPGPDGSTNVAVGTAVTAPGYTVYDLPAGSYVITTTGTTPSASLARIKLG
jgi:hypothetical protein